MKIKEAAKTYADSIVPLDGHDKYSAPFITAFERHEDVEDAFKAGVEFAQRWIPVDEELPTTNDEKYLVKVIGWGIGLHPFNEHYQCWDDEDGDDYFTDAIGGKITHWRKIELT
jgi:hypothetical protein